MLDLEEGLVEDAAHCALFEGVWRLFFSDHDYELVTRAMRTLAKERNIEEDDVLFFSSDPVTEGYFAALNAYTSQTRFARHLRKGRPEVYAEVIRGAMGRDNVRISEKRFAHILEPMPVASGRILNGRWGWAQLPPGFEIVVHDFDEYAAAVKR